MVGSDQVERIVSQLVRLLAKNMHCIFISSMNSNVTGEGDGAEAEVKKKSLQFSAINSDF